MPADVVVLWQEAAEGKVEIIGREPSHSEMWKRTHLRKGSRPFDKDIDCSSSVVENVDLEDVDLEGVELEGIVQEKKIGMG
ncbi:hypothetical protein HanXRQr2_Chr00c029g0833061 [Helianthus annuus]|uniref:Uncharacterized protein n=1 Tax=Helianthus annuus TaxID=4232 RepID=A0A9K3JZ96_HELAN|nr:hypothetical protein HanXRQr2_Chr00c029g0833061 [Helianthus annuus]